jgi:hypothetical protein
MDRFYQAKKKHLKETETGKIFINFPRGTAKHGQSVQI